LFKNINSDKLISLKQFYLNQFKEVNHTKKIH